MSTYRLIFLSVFLSHLSFDLNDLIQSTNEKASYIALQNFPLPIDQPMKRLHSWKVQSYVSCYYIYNLITITDHEYPPVVDMYTAKICFVHNHFLPLVHRCKLKTLLVHRIFTQVPGTQPSLVHRCTIIF